MVIKQTDKETGMRVHWNVVDNSHLARFCIKHCHAEDNLTNFEETVYMHAQLTSGQIYDNAQGSWELVK